MPRREVVSRTMTVTICWVLCLDREKNEVIQKVIHIKGHFDDPEENKSLERKLRKECENQGYKFVDLADWEERVMRGVIDMNEFMKVCKWVDD